MSVSEYPGFVSLAPELQELLLRVEGGDEDVRPALLERVAGALNVFIGLELLQFVFVPEGESDGAERVEIDLIAPGGEEPAVAWFSVDEAGYDEFRDVVSLFGDLADILNPPIVLDVDDAQPGAPEANGAP
jgi:hypothetical protein